MVFVFPHSYKLVYTPYLLTSVNARYLYKVPAGLGKFLWYMANVSAVLPDSYSKDTML